MPGQKRKQFSVEDKLSILKRIRNGEQQTKVARELDINESTVRGWLRSEEKLKSFAAELDGDEGLKRKRTKSAADPVLDKAVFSWYSQQRAEGITISTEILKHQAQKIDKQLNGEGSSFVASSGWAFRFNQRHGIAAFTPSEAMQVADQTTVSAFIRSFHEMLKENGYVAEQVYSCKESSLFYHQLGKKTLVFEHDLKKRDEMKKFKDRVTFLFACNYTGTHKLKPLAIGHYKTPRCFYHINMSHLPVSYNNSANSWMTTSIFENWFYQDFVPAVGKHLGDQGLEPKAILLLDNCPAHAPDLSLVSGDRKIKVYYLPKNTTVKIQPLDQGIITNFKIKYRNELKQAVVQDPHNILELLKNINLKTSFYLAGAAWNKVKPTIINNCFIKALGPILDPEEVEDFESLMMSKIQAASTNIEADPDMQDPEASAEIDEELSICQKLADEEILQEAVRTFTSIIISSDTNSIEEEEAVLPPPKRTASECVSCIESCIDYIEQLDGNQHQVKLLQLQGLLSFFKQEQKKRNETKD